MYIPHGEVGKLGNQSGRFLPHGTSADRASMSRAYYVVDAFTTGPFTGNPAAVLLDAEGLRDEQMAAIAAEFNLSETTFVLPVGDDVTGHGPGEPASSHHHLRFRWFTPTIEVGMCGHATVAGVHALVESGRIEWNGGDQPVEVRIETKSGRITTFVERWPGEGGGRIYWLELIPPTLSPARVDRFDLAKLLGLEVDALEGDLPLARTQDDDVIVFVKDVMRLNEARPDFRELGLFGQHHHVRGFSLATVQTLTPSVNVQSRFFAPTAGVNEDPVTGSVHGPLCAYMVKHGLVPLHEDTAGMVCVQGIPGGRTGLLYGLVRVQQDGTMISRVGGKAVTTMRGELVIE